MILPKQNLSTCVTYYIISDTVDTFCDGLIIVDINQEVEYDNEL